jgi:N-methylhydantoinase B/oxoprolinase/acetone carboxylase alpha subunit
MTVAPERTSGRPDWTRVTDIPVTPHTVYQWIKPERATAAEEEWMTLLDPGDFEIYGEKLKTFLDEAREIFIRSGVTSMLRSGDLIVGLYTPNGDLADASAGTYLHCVTASMPVKYVLHKYFDDPTVGVRPGDIFYANEAAYGGIHNPDQMAFMPVFHGDELIAWTAALSHQPESGASEPGGMPLNANSRNDEGMKLTPIKIGENYQIRSDMLDMMVNFISRAPRMQAIDTRARVTGADRLRVRIQQLAEDRGADFVRGLLRKLVVEAETAARRRISRWNDGTYRAVVFCDTIGKEPAIIRCSLSAVKKGDTITMDFTGTSPEQPSSYNCYPHIVAAHAAIHIFAYPFHDLPVSNGTLAAFDWVCPAGTIYNAAPDAAISNSPTLNSMTMSATPIALSKMMFDSPDRDKVAAPISAVGSVTIFAGVSQHGVPIAEFDATVLNNEGQGARPHLDGEHAYGFPWCHAGRSPDTEDTETEYPLLRLFHGLRIDNGGFGRTAGGAGAETAVVPHHVPGLFFLSLGKCAFIGTTPGLFGGYPGGPAPAVWVTQTDLWEKMAANAPLPKNSVELATLGQINGTYLFEHGNRPPRPAGNGDIILQLASGGGGYGDVLERDPDLVLKDRRDRIISDFTATRIYCIRYDAETLELDREATDAARAEERQTRLSRGKSWDEFQAEWSQLRPDPEAVKHFGTWPDGVREMPLIRM